MKEASVISWYHVYIFKNRDLYCNIIFLCPFIIILFICILIESSKFYRIY